MRVEQSPYGRLYLGATWPVHWAGGGGGGSITPKILPQKMFPLNMTAFGVPGRSEVR